jgi:ankyrin repeat protein
VDIAGISPLMLALLTRDLDAIQALLIAGVPIGLHEAALLDDAHTVKRLHAIGVDMLSTTDTGWTALHLAAWAGSGAVVQVLLDQGIWADLPSVGPHAITGCTPLALAVTSGQAAVTQQLLDAGADPARRDDAGWMPLHQASERGDLHLVKRLLIGGADVNALCGDTTPLGLAEMAGHHEVVALLHQVGGTH